MTATHLALLLTSAACPGQLIGPVLLPQLCWPYKENDRLLLVVGLYSGLVAGLLALVLGEQVTRRIRRGAGTGAALAM